MQLVTLGATCDDKLWMTINTAQSLQEKRFIIISLYKVGVLKYWVPCCPNDKILYCSAYYFWHNYCIFFLDTKMCVSSHALSSKHQIIVTFTGHFWILGLQGNILHVTLPAPIILAWVPDFWRICGPLVQGIHLKHTSLTHDTHNLAEYILQDGQVAQFCIC